MKTFGHGNLDTWVRRGWERVEEAPWIAYFLGCALLCCAGLLIVGSCRVFWHLCSKTAQCVRSHAPGHAMALLFAMLLLAGCDRTFFAWQGPTQRFAAADIDRNAELSREEWERWYGTSALNAAVLDFDRGDCDRNGRLSWEEYFRLRYRTDRCAPGALELLQRQSPASWFAGNDPPSIFSAKEVDQAWLSLVRNRQRLIDAKYHAEYSEQDLPVGATHVFKMRCGDPEPLEVPATSQDFREISRLPLLDVGIHTAIRCTVENGMRDGTITCLRLRFLWEEPEGRIHTFHVKTLWVPPQSTRDLWVLPPKQKSPAAIDLLAVRVKGT